MTQAPATTVANAVRKHGGGRHPLNLLCTAPAGRLQDSSGGVIDRRAEGATSSNTLPASCAAAAHPTTGVRRARELSPSLRSQNRPHAQLVEGYKTYQLKVLLGYYVGRHVALLAALGVSISKPLQLMIGVLEVDICVYLDTPDPMTDTFKHGVEDQGPSHTSLNLKDINELQEFLPKLKNERHFASIAPLIIEPTQQILKDIKPSLGTKIFVCLARGINPLVEEIELIDQVENSSSLCPTRLGISELPIQTHSPALVFSAVPLALKLLLTNKPSDEDRTDGAERLNPAWSILQADPGDDNLNCPAKDSNRHKSPNNPDGSNSHPLGNFPFAHSNPLLLDNHPSLPAPCHHVQRGAA